MGPVSSIPDHRRGCLRQPPQLSGLLGMCHLSTKAKDVRVNFYTHTGVKPMNKVKEYESAGNNVTTTRAVGLRRIASHGVEWS